MQCELEWSVRRASTMPWADVSSITDATVLQAGVCHLQLLPLNQPLFTLPETVPAPFSKRKILSYLISFL